jgi:nucleotide-binding universal stress UspA family protein
MYKTILVPLDGSKNAEAILPHVEALLSQNQEAKAILLRIVEPQKFYPSTGGYIASDYLDYEKATKEAETYLSAIRDRLSKKGIETETHITPDTPVKGIVYYAEHRKVDLIAMASHGRTGLARVFYGSVAAGVLHQVDRPLLLVRANSHN